MLYIPTRELYQFEKIINMFRVGIPSPISRRKKSDIALVGIYIICYMNQLELYQFMKMIHMFRVETPQPFFRKLQKFKKGDLIFFLKIEKSIKN